MELVREVLDRYRNYDLYIGLGASQHNNSALDKLSSGTDIVSLMIDPAHAYGDDYVSKLQNQFPGAKVTLDADYPPADLDSPNQVMAQVYKVRFLVGGGKNDGAGAAAARGPPVHYVAFVRYELPGNSVDLSGDDPFPPKSCKYFLRNRSKCRVGDHSIGLYLMEKISEIVRRGNRVSINNQIVFNTRMPRGGYYNEGYYFEAYICWMLDIFDKLSRTAGFPDDRVFVSVSQRPDVQTMHKYIDNLCELVDDRSI